MTLIDDIQKHITEAMKARDELRLSTLRMVKTALKNREIDKMAPLDDKESQQILTTLRDRIVGQEPACEPIQRTKETLETRTEQRVLSPVAGDHAVVEDGERPPNGFVLKLGNPARKSDGVHRALLPVFVSAGVNPSSATGSEVTLPALRQPHNHRHSG